MAKHVPLACAGGRFTRHCGLTTPTRMRDARAVMHAGIANQRFLLKLVAGKTFAEFPAHAQSAILRIR